MVNSASMPSSMFGLHVSRSISNIRRHFFGADNQFAKNNENARVFHAERGVKLSWHWDLAKLCLHWQLVLFHVIKQQPHYRHTDKLNSGWHQCYTINIKHMQDLLVFIQILADNHLSWLTTANKHSLMWHLQELLTSVILHCHQMYRVNSCHDDSMINTGIGIIIIIILISCK